MTDDPWKDQLKALGEFIRSQRELARLSLRDLADRTQVSNPYLSQIERGMHEPSIRVLKSIATALNMSAESLLAHAGLLAEDDLDGVAADDDSDSASSVSTEDAIRADTRLTKKQKDTLISVYRSFVEAE